MRCQVSDNRYINYKLYKDYRWKFEHALAFTIEMKNVEAYSKEKRVYAKL